MFTNHARKILLSAILFIAASLATACSPTKAAENEARDVLALRNGSVFTATGVESVPNSAIIIEDGLITAVGPEEKIEIPEGVVSIDVEGRTILPGLIDAHTHVLEKMVIEDGQLNQINVRVFLMSALNGGVTTVRDLNWPVDDLDEIADMRSALESYGNTVPTVILTGPGLAHTDGPWFKAFSGYGVKTVEDAREAVQHLADAGVDQIKIALNMRPSAWPPTGDPPKEISPSLSLEQVQAIVDVAHENGLWVTAHVTDEREAEIALAAEVDELAHWPAKTQSLSDAILKDLVEDNIPVVSTFTITPPQEGDARRFLEASGILIFGSDAPGTGSISNPYNELNGMFVAGMNPQEIILSATFHAAQAVGLGDLVGTLEVGKQADIIVVDGDPFEDFRVMRDVVYVVKGGELVVQPEASEE